MRNCRCRQVLLSPHDHEDRCDECTRHGTVARFPHTVGHLGSPGCYSVEDMAYRACQSISIRQAK